MKYLLEEDRNVEYLGYKIQVAGGIVYPSKNTLECIENLKKELSKVLEKFKKEKPKEYKCSEPVSFYKHYCE